MVVEKVWELNVNEKLGAKVLRKRIEIYIAIITIGNEQVYYDFETKEEAIDWCIKNFLKKEEMKNE